MTGRRGRVAAALVAAAGLISLTACTSDGPSVPSGGSVQSGGSTPYGGSTQSAQAERATPPVSPRPAHATGTPDATASPGLGAPPPAGWHAVDPHLAPVAPGRIHRVTWHIRDVPMTVAPGVRQVMWTFDGRVPGPVLHGHMGDRFVITVINDTGMIHSIDFHAEQGAPATTMKPIPPGGQVTYHFTAARSGAFLYHCGTDPILEHIGNGMYGAVIIDPPGLRPVAAQYVFVGSELFFGPQGKSGDYPKMQRDDADAVVFNGYPFAYKQEPIAVPAGKPVRIWVVDAGPSRALSFHVVGAQFSAVYLDGGYLVPPGPASGAGETLPVDPGDGGFAELRFAGTGTYPFLTHRLADAELGATGLFAAS